jgi:hypothetical protein
MKEMSEIREMRETRETRELVVLNPGSEEHKRSADIH